jgi:L-threonylcarbamoyladenylate synthase
MTTTNEQIKQAAKILAEGGLVAFPTETVYGLGADAANEIAVRKVFRAKERPLDHPLIVHISHINQLEDWAQDVPAVAFELAEAFWPGPLTLILKKRAHVIDVVTGSQQTVGIRIPKHPVARALLETFGRGVAAPSANKFTHLSPTTAAAVREELGGRVGMVLDGGACEVGLESTIIDLSQSEPAILRPGMLTAEAIAAKLNIVLLPKRQVQSDVRAPGMHHLHYAPTTSTKIIARAEMTELLSGLRMAELPVVVLVREQAGLPTIEHVFWVKMPTDAVSYAHELYRVLRSLDAQHYKHIFVEAVPETSEWEAIRDRLTKASR